MAPITEGVGVSKNGALVSQDVLTADDVVAPMTEVVFRYNLSVLMLTKEVHDDPVLIGRAFTLPEAPAIDVCPGYPVRSIRRTTPRLPVVAQPNSSLDLAR